MKFTRRGLFGTLFASAVAAPAIVEAAKSVMVPKSLPEVALRTPPVQRNWQPACSAVPWLATAPPGYWDPRGYVHYPRTGEESGHE